MMFWWTWKSESTSSTIQPRSISNNTNTNIRREYIQGSNTNTNKNGKQRHLTQQFEELWKLFVVVFFSLSFCLKLSTPCSGNGWLRRLSLWCMFWLSSSSIHFHSSSSNRFLGLADALCILQDGSGRGISTKKLPNGVFYTPDTDSLECLTPESCRGWRISNCFGVVSCKGIQSCQDVTFVNNQNIGCWSIQACANAWFEKSHDVACDNTGRVPHNQASCDLIREIHTDAQILCYGRDSCLDQHSIHVGHVGHVRCTNGHGKPACRDMTIYLKEHPGGAGKMDRDCFGTDEDLHTDCAVICASRHDCDRYSIRFVFE